jgi:hypothetical protein
VTPTSPERAPGGPDSRLSPRDREILRDVVRAYIVRGEPISSRTVARQTGLGVSAATIRNAMADLEEVLDVMPGEVLRGKVRSVGTGVGPGKPPQPGTLPAELMTRKSP